MIEHIGERHSEGTSISFAIKPIHAKKIQENRHVCEKFDESQVESQNTHFLCHSEEMFSNLLKTQFVLPVKKKEEKRKKKRKRKTVKKGEADFALTDACM